MFEIDAQPPHPGSEEGPATGVAAPRTRERRARRRILVVEDDALLRESMVELLRGEGFHVSIAVDGNEAIEVLSTDARIELVLLDLLLPVKTGFDVLRHVQVLERDLPVIVLTGSGLKQGAVGKHKVLAKDVGYDVLLEHIQRLLS